MESRLIELETRLAFQDDTIAALNEVVIAQQRQLERLQAQVIALGKRQEELQGRMGAPEIEPLPPHY